MTAVVLIPTVNNDLSNTVCVKFVSILDQKAWDFVNNEWTASPTTYSNILNNVSYSNLLSGFSISLPSGIERGRLYLYVFDGDKASVSQDTRAVRCFEMMVSSGAIVGTPAPMVSDGVA